MATSKSKDRRGLFGRKSGTKPQSPEMSPEVEKAMQTEVGRKIVESKEAELRNEAAKRAQESVIKTHDSRKRAHAARMNVMENQAAEANANLANAAKEMKRGQRGYDTFTSAMIELLLVCDLFIKVLKIKNPAGIVWNKLAHNLLIDQLRLGRDIKSAVKEAREATYSVDPLPKIFYDINMSTDDKLELSSLHEKLLREDGSPLLQGVWSEDELQQNMQQHLPSQSLEEGVIDWLDKCGCSYDKSTKKVTNNNTHADIDAATFQSMKDHPESGMSAFFTGRFVEPAPTVAIRP